MAAKLWEGTTVFFIGAAAYPGIELLWRQRTHWTMGIAGGLCLLILYVIYNGKRLALFWNCAIGSAVITTVEFLLGVVVNLWAGWDVWDYSGMAFHLLGQVCPLYSGLWGLLSIPIVFVSRGLKRVLARISPFRAGRVKSLKRAA